MSSEKQGFDQPPPYPYSPQNEGYPQQPGNYPPPQQGYPQQPGGYPPPQQGYPQQGGPPPQGYAYGQGYAPPQGQYPQTTQQTVVMTQPAAGAIIIGQNRPPDYLIPSILACLCCFWPTGLCAIYYACRANTLVGQGDMPAAQSASTTARNLMITSIVIGAICVALIIILRVVLVTSHASAYSY